VDAVVESGDVVAEPTTVVDFVDGVPEVVREGAGDPDRFR
jgi:tRNA A37 threonylcarbamoyladenosine synthetase subunit TsaC/SUA5/YrdC